MKIKIENKITNKTDFILTYNFVCSSSDYRWILSIRNIPGLFFVFITLTTTLKNLHKRVSDIERLLQKSLDFK